MMATLEYPPTAEPHMAANCPECGSNNTHRVQVKDSDGKVVRVYFECLGCGNVW